MKTLNAYPSCNLFLLFIPIFLLTGCEKSPDHDLFENLPASQTGIGFVNRILDKKELNIFNYRNFYNGGGVAIGDVNNDGWADIYVTSNFEENHLYLNKGKNPAERWQFDDVTIRSGVGGTKAWSTGATFADVNGDGLMDIYVCNAGNMKGDKRGNELFINQGIGPDGVPKFIDKATEYGLLDGGFSTHAAFFDYDRDGDLDMYLLNNSFTPVDKLQYQNFRKYRDPLGGHKLFRNDGPPAPDGGVNNKSPLGGRSGTPPPGGRGGFTDVSEEAGIYGSLIAFGLGITIGDVNDDNWPDVYISNDFYERDYLYINQRDGTFKESLEESMKHISLSSMGADIADINNDGQLDIFVTDMLPQDDKRLKTTSVFEGYELTDFKLKQDYWHQYMRNMLHLNQGSPLSASAGGVSTPTFTEVGQLAGVHATDWSWGALIFDMDNDGQKDLFIANGIVKNLTDQDYVAFLSDQSNIQAMIEGRMQFDYRKFVDMISTTPIPNFAFRNKGGLQFEDKAETWGLGEPGFSNGAAYGDLDNDGDLDLVVNNNNAALGVYRNQSVEKLKTHFLRVKLKGTGANPHAIGAKVFVYQKGQIQYLQQMPNRGFQSSSDLNLIFGLGKNAIIDSLTVIWPDDKKQSLKNLKADTEISLDYAAANDIWRMPVPKAISTPFKDITAASGIDFLHEENDFVDYNRDGLLKQMYSTQGPALAVGDVNGDGLDDVYIGGGAGKPRALFIQQANGQFTKSAQSTFATPNPADETAATFFDADGDKDKDLYVVTGGNEFLPDNAALADQLYVNDGKGNFTLSAGLPRFLANGSCVVAADYDRDGDQDLFVGTRMISGQYGDTPKSFLLQNNGKGQFTDVTGQDMSNNQLGMVTDAQWADLNQDGYPELIAVGDWMPIVILQNQKGSFPQSLNRSVAHSSGWWNTLTPTDIDNDGDLDFIVGNLGRNTKLQCSEKEPAQLYVNDFDRNGSVEQIIVCYNPDGKAYPMVLKPDLQKVLPVIKKRFVKHVDYAGQSIEAVFTNEQLNGVRKKSVSQPNSSMLLNDGKGNFELSALPWEAQLAPVFGISTTDYDHDGKLDILLTGNFFDVLPEIGRYDANDGLVLKGIGKGTDGKPQFAAVKPAQSGFSVSGQVRKMRKARTSNGKEMIILAKNKDKVQVFGFNK
ncbi:MAG: VCBS repeat-containing protein [Spirosomataceae bacterium]